MKSMSFTILFTLLVSTVAQATAMSPETSKCFGLRIVAEDHAKWKPDFARYRSEIHFGTPSNVVPLRKSLLMVVERIEKVRRSAKIAVDQSLLDDAYLLASDYDSGRLSVRYSFTEMQSSLLDLETELDSALMRAQSKMQDCDLAAESKDVHVSPGWPARNSSRSEN